MVPAQTKTGPVKPDRFPPVWLTLAATCWCQCYLPNSLPYPISINNASAGCRKQQINPSAAAAAPAIQSHGPPPQGNPHHDRPPPPLLPPPSSPHLGDTVVVLLHREQNTHFSHIKEARHKGKGKAVKALEFDNIPLACQRNMQLDHSCIQSTGKRHIEINLVLHILLPSQYGARREAGHAAASPSWPTVKHHHHLL